MEPRQHVLDVAAGDLDRGRHARTAGCVRAHRRTHRTLGRCGGSSNAMPDAARPAMRPCTWRRGLGRPGDRLRPRSDELLHGARGVHADGRARHQGPLLLPRARALEHSGRVPSPTPTSLAISTPSRRTTGATAAVGTSLGAGALAHLLAREPERFERWCSCCRPRSRARSGRPAARRAHRRAARVPASRRGDRGDPRGVGSGRGTTRRSPGSASSTCCCGRT